MGLMDLFRGKTRQTKSTPTAPAPKHSNPGMGTASPTRRAKLKKKAARKRSKQSRRANR